VPVSAPPEGFEARVERALNGFAAPVVSSDVRRQLIAYCNLAVTWGQRLDLTAARSADELVDLLLADALAIASAQTASADDRWLDVGSGVGAPGIPLALLLPVKMTLVEPREKRVAFLRTAVGSLARSDIVVSRTRSDVFPPASCEVAVSRATLPPQEWLTEGARLATRGVWLLLAKAGLPELGSHRVLTDIRYRWPLTGALRRAVCLSAGDKLSEP
jgi:16S rRNA (guanine527-N7)-methyltransferase